MSHYKAILKSFRRFLTKNLRNMNHMRKRRESVVSVCRKTTKFLKYRLLARVVEDYDNEPKQVKEKSESPKDKGLQYPDSEEDIDLGERDLDFYLGVRKKETFWRDPLGKEQIRKDFLIYHCGVSEEDYEKYYKKTVSGPRLSYTVPPKLKQVPFKIHKKRSRKSSFPKDSDTWREKSGIFKLFRRDSEYSTTESFSECDSDDEGDDNEELSDDAMERFNALTTDDTSSLEGVQINEVSEGRPCDNCPELCPGFIPHSWRKTCKACGCDRLKHSVYHEELASVRYRLGLKPEQNSHHSYDSPPGLTAKQSEQYWAALAERAPTSIGGATGVAAWRAWKTRALATQLPKQDLSLAHCRHIDEKDQKHYEDFVAARNEIALDIGLALQHQGSPVECMGCEKSIRSGSIAVQAPKLGDEALFHPGCFTCTSCSEPLVELAHCVFEGRVYCARHYDEQLKPRCEACDEVRFKKKIKKKQKTKNK